MNRSGFPSLSLSSRLWMVALSVLIVAGCVGDAGPEFVVELPDGAVSDAQDGRLLLLISDDTTAEPRFQITDAADTQLAFGRNVEEWSPGGTRVVDERAFGYPLDSLSHIPAGEYRVQAFLNRYETFRRGDGHTVKLPPDRGEGQVWNRKPGNLYSEPRTVQMDPSSGGEIRLTLNEQIPELPELEETEYIKRVRIQSDLLTEFWGRPMYVKATILLPEGWEEHPDARYPLMVYQGHHHREFYTPVGFRPEPPGDSLEGYDRTYAEYSHRFYEDWTGPDFPRMILVTIQHANPYYDDSYAVNSANLGPYGDALTHELIPHIEEEYRGIGEGWARVLYGGSTGGWEALAAQIFYPDEYAGAWSFCPDPVDFRAYEQVNIYEDENAYFLDSEWKETPRPGRRNWLGHVDYTLEEANHYELVLGDNGRSGDQWDIWQAVFGPVGEDGYPKPIWDKRTGEIDHEVAEYWRENYDLRHILERDWETLGPRLEDKLHIYVGDMDNYYLNNAVYLMEDFLESTEDPYYGGVVEYGDRYEHCWTGDHDAPNSISRLTINQRFAPEMERRIIEAAPPGADTTSWRY